MASTRRVLTVLGSVAGVALVVAGVVIGYAGYHRADGPADAVRGYFDALAGSDAPRALAWGSAAGGPTSLLTSAVLREQQRIAPITGVRVDDVRRTGSTASVRVRYDLRFADGVRHADTRVALVRRGDHWRLRRTTVQTQFVIGYASDRARVLTAPVPSTVVQVFPGAAPVSFDSDYLELTPSTAAIALDAGPAIDLTAQVSDDGRKVISAAVDAKLARCVTGPADATCPVPDGSYVPGSLHGRVDRTSEYVMTLQPSSDGLVQIAATVPFTGRYRRLDFVNRVSSGTGSVVLDVHASTYAVDRFSIHWDNA